VCVSQGGEAGGHTGSVATSVLLPQVVDAVKGRVPVVAAGGIFAGRGLAAALSMGAAGAWIGTRFLMTPEAHMTPEVGTHCQRGGRNPRERTPLPSCFPSSRAQRRRSSPCHHCQ